MQVLGNNQGQLQWLNKRISNSRGMVLKKFKKSILRARVMKKISSKKPYKAAAFRCSSDNPEAKIQII